MKKSKRILIIRPDRIGDVILSTPLIREIKRSFPDSFLAVMVNPYTKDVLLNNPNINQIIIDNSKDLSKKYFFQQVKLIRSYKFDIAMMLLPTERHSWMLFLAGIRNRIGVGTKLYQVLTFTKSVSRNKYIPLRHEADYCMDFGRKIGITPISLDTEIFITEEEKKEFISIHQEEFKFFNSILNRKIIGIHPGSNKSAPNWKIENYIHLAKLLLDNPNNIIVLTGNNDEIHFAPKFKSLNSSRIINFIGKLSLRELCILISFFDVLVSSSTGPMHIAAGLKIPTVSLFCTLTACSPTLWGPLGNKSKIMTPPLDFCNNFCKDDPHNCDFNDSISINEVVNNINILINEQE